MGSRLGTIFGLCLLCGVRTGAGVAAPRPPVALIDRTVAEVRVSYLAVRLRDPHIRVRVEMCDGYPGGDETFWRMIHRLQPVGAIGGAYYSKDSKLPIGDIVVDGRLVRQGMMGTALAITRRGVPTMRRVPWGHKVDWKGYDLVLGSGPALVLSGHVDVQPQRERFHDPHILRMVPRLAIGYTADQHLLLVYVREAVSFDREALVMEALGCVGAMNLDAGPGLAFYYHQRFLAMPRRAMTNIICVYDRKKAL